MDLCIFSARCRSSSLVSHAFGLYSLALSAALSAATDVVAAASSAAAIAASIAANAAASDAGDADVAGAGAWRSQRCRRI